MSNDELLAECRNTIKSLSEGMVYMTNPNQETLDGVISSEKSRQDMINGAAEIIEAATECGKLTARRTASEIISLLLATSKAASKRTSHDRPES